MNFQYILESIYFQDKLAQDLAYSFFANNSQGGTFISYAISESIIDYANNITTFRLLSSISYLCNS